LDVDEEKIILVNKMIILFINSNETIKGALHKHITRSIGQNGLQECILRKAIRFSFETQVCPSTQVHYNAALVDLFLDQIWSICFMLKRRLHQHTDMLW